MQNGEQLFWALADDLLNRPGITRSTMMGNPCLRCDGAFFACVESKTGRLIVKLPGARVLVLVSSGRAVPFVPNGRAFREWAAFPGQDERNGPPSSTRLNDSSVPHRHSMNRTSGPPWAGFDGGHLKH